MEEKWREVPGSNGRYWITLDTKQGRCVSINYKGSNKVKELTNKPDKKGRLYWGLLIDGKKINYQAGRWIALTYPELIQNEYFEGAEIDHINTNPLDNRPENLRWVTRRDNINNPNTLQHLSETRKGRKQREETIKKRAKSLINNPGKIKPVQQFTKDWILIAEYPSAAEAERKTGIQQTNITKICRGERRFAGGYIWKFKS